FNSTTIATLTRRGDGIKRSFFDNTTRVPLSDSDHSISHSLVPFPAVDREKHALCLRRDRVELHCRKRGYNKVRQKLRATYGVATQLAQLGFGKRNLEKAIVPRGLGRTT